MGYGCHGMRGRNAPPVVAMARGAGPGAAQPPHMLACLVVALRQRLGVAKASRHLSIWPLTLTFFPTPSISFPIQHCFVLHIHISTNISDEGEWTSWEDWSSCTAACGAGTQSRSRGYSGGLPCSGNSSQTANCYGISH